MVTRTYSCVFCTALYIQRIESSHNDVDGDSVKMHDLMRAMALKITEGFGNSRAQFTGNPQRRRMVRGS